MRSLDCKLLRTMVFGLSLNLGLGTGTSTFRITSIELCMIISSISEK